MRRRLTAILGLEALALFLAGAQSVVGLRTDEAKYLLDIPYPHPPLLRGLMHLTEVLPFQETLWRALLATAFVQAVWLVADLGRSLPRDRRLALCMVWLLSGGVLLQAGALLLAPINALQGLVFVWLLSRPELVRRYPACVGGFWLASVLTGYQAVLFGPLVLAAFLRAGVPVTASLLYAGAPVGVLMLYTLSNPLAAASLAHHGGDEAVAPLGYKLFHTVRLWLIGGSVAGSVVGAWGVLRSRRWELVAASACVTGFVFLNWFEYYAVLFTPLLVAGAAAALSRSKVRALPMVGLMVAGAVVTLALFPPHLSGSAARATMAALRVEGVRGTVLVSGTFGHEWQYESAWPIDRFSPERTTSAAAVACPAACAGWTPDGAWRAVPGTPVPIWIRR